MHPNLRKYQSHVQSFLSNPLLSHICRHVRIRPVLGAKKLLTHTRKRVKLCVEVQNGNESST